MFFVLLTVFCVNFGQFLQLSVPYDLFMPSKMHLCSVCELFFSSISGVTVFQKENWPQNGRFCIFLHHFSQILGLLQLSELQRSIFASQGAFFGIVLFAQTCSVQLWSFSAPNKKSASKLTILAYFAAFNAPMTYLCLLRFIFGIVLFTKPFVWSIQAIHIEY